MDYTLGQSTVGSLTQALAEAFGDRLQVGGRLAARSVEEVAAALRVAHTWDGAVTLGPARPGVLSIDLGGLTAVREIDVQSGLVTAEAAIAPRALDAALADEGLELHRDLFSDLDGPIGAAIAAGEGAPAIVSLGAVLPDGIVFHTPIAPRRATGPNPDALLVGSQGRFAVIAWATLRVCPRQPGALLRAWRGPAAEVLDATRRLLRGAVPELGVRARRGKTGPLTVSWRLPNAAAEAEVAAAMTAAGASACEPDDAPPSDGLPRRLGWTALGRLLARRAPLFVGGMDVHGGYARVPGDAAGSDALQEAVDAAVDPVGTLRRGR